MLPINRNSCKTRVTMSIKYSNQTIPSNQNKFPVSVTMKGLSQGLENRIGIAANN